MSESPVDDALERAVADAAGTAPPTRRASIEADEADAADQAADVPMDEEEYR